MNHWQYAWLTDQPQAAIGFSHPQPGLAMELAAVLGPGVMVQTSTDWAVNLDRSRVNLGYLSGLLGDRGWEMFAVETRLQPGAYAPNQLQTNWYFKRPAPEGDAAAGRSVAASQQPTPVEPTPMAQPMQPQQPTPPMQPQAWPQPMAPDAPAPTPPPGPDQAPTSGAPTAPSGEQSGPQGG